MKEGLYIGGLLFIALAIGAGAYWITSMPAKTPETQSEQQTSSVQVTELAKGARSKETRRVNYLIKSQPELKQLWNMLESVGSLPKVDFETNTVIAVFAGEQPTLGYDIRITKIEDSATARKVFVTLSKPGGSCITGQVITSPFHIVVVPATALPLTHADSVSVTSCLQ